MRLPLVIASLVTLLVAPTALAAEPFPVVVTVQGEGSIRVVLAAGSTTPCDSTSNTLMFDGRLEAGHSYGFMSPDPIVCERHTRGALREVDWSTDRLWGQRPPLRGFPAPPPHPLDVVLDTRR